MPTIINGTTGIDKVQDDSVDISDLSATGTPSSSTYLRGDGVWNSIEGLPSGTVLYVAQNTAPTGYIKANGAAISRTTYAALFSAIGTTFGSGDGSTTFNVPDLRGEFIRGWDDSRGIDSGRSFGSAQSDELKSHSHTVNSGIQSYASTSFATGNPNSYPTSYSTNSTGGAETRPRNIALLACIKY